MEFLKYEALFLDSSNKSSAFILILFVLLGSTIPDLLKDQILILNKYSKKHNFILIKAFNEWAEGNILEPYYINELFYEPGHELKNLIT